MPARKRKLSDSSSLQVPEEPPRQRSRSPSPGPPSGRANIANAVKGLFSKTPDPTNPVLNGASFAAQPRPAIGDFFRTIASQAGRGGDNVSLISSFVDTAIFDGGYVDDRKYQVSHPMIMVYPQLMKRTDGANHSTSSIFATRNENIGQSDRSIPQASMEQHRASATVVSRQRVQVPHG